MTKARKPNHPTLTQGAGTEVMTPVEPCVGWIQIHSHYVNYNLNDGDDIAVAYTARLFRVEGESESPVGEPIEVFYTSLKLDTAAATGDVPATAVTNGNPKVNIGGTTGYPPGRYKLTLAPEIHHGKIRLRPAPEADNTYVILNTAGADSGQRTDIYVQVPSTTTVETEWSETFDLACGPITAPHVLRFAWADFRTWDNVTTARITGTGNLIQPGLDASETCLNTISPAMTTALGANWRTTAVTNAYFPIDPRIRYWAFILINKTEELIARRVRITNPGRSANFQKFLYERRQQCNGAAAAAPWYSNHQYGLAFDAQHGTDVNESPPNNTDVQVLVADAIGLDWGGNWGSADFPHFEYTGATSRVSNYRTQMTGTTPTTITYGGYQYVQTP